MSDARRLRILLVADLPDFVVEDFAAHFDIIRGGLELARTAAVDAVLISVETRLSEDIITALPPSVRVICTYSVGMDHIDLPILAARGITLFKTPDVLSQSVAEAAMFLMLGAARRATESIDLIRSGRWEGWGPRQLIGMELAGKQLGILGMGSIGREIARRAAAFDMTVAYTNRSGLAAAKAGSARFLRDWRDLLRTSDVLVLACPSTAETRGFLNARNLLYARHGMILVNIGRGDLVVDDALIDALRCGRIGAAGLDVFAGEPLFDRRYLELPNVFILPHIGSSTREARRGMGRTLLIGLNEWAASRVPAQRNSV
jgi:lactate dehydrogenase-like 2-hydroxyacid dehydrogenase